MRALPWRRGVHPRLGSAWQMTALLAPHRPSAMPSWDDHQYRQSLSTNGLPLGWPGERYKESENERKEENKKK